MKLLDIFGPERNRFPKESVPDIVYNNQHPGFFTISPRPNFDPVLETQLGLLFGALKTAESHPLGTYRSLERLLNPFGTETATARFYLPNAITITPAFFDKALLREFMEGFDIESVQRMIGAIPEEYPAFKLFGDDIRIQVECDGITMGHIGRNIVHCRCRWRPARSMPDVNASGIAGILYREPGPLAPGTAVAQPPAGTAVAQPPKGTAVARGPRRQPLCFIDWRNDGTFTPLFDGDVLGRSGSGTAGVRDEMPWATASGRHFRIETGSAGPLIRDIGSRNGTVVERGGSTPITLHAGQTCEIENGGRIGVMDTDGTMSLAAVSLPGTEETA